MSELEKVKEELDEYCKASKCFNKYCVTCIIAFVLAREKRLTKEAIKKIEGL